MQTHVCAALLSKPLGSVCLPVCPPVFSYCRLDSVPVFQDRDQCAHPGAGLRGKNGEFRAKRATAREEVVYIYNSVGLSPAARCTAQQWLAAVQCVAQSVHRILRKASRCFLLLSVFGVGATLRASSHRFQVDYEEGSHRSDQPQSQHLPHTACRGKGFALSKSESLLLYLERALRGDPSECAHGTRNCGRRQALCCFETIELKVGAIYRERAAGRTEYGRADSFRRLVP